MARDPGLDAALRRAVPLLGDQPVAAQVRALAIRGADALVEDGERRREAIESLILFSLREDDLVAWIRSSGTKRSAWSKSSTGSRPTMASRACGRLATSP